MLPSGALCEARNVGPKCAAPLWGMRATVFRVLHEREAEYVQGHQQRAAGQGPRFVCLPEETRDATLRFVLAGDVPYMGILKMRNKTAVVAGDEPSTPVCTWQGDTIVVGSDHIPLQSLR